MEMYGSQEPPEYDLSKITTKIHILYGTNDRIAPPEVQSLQKYWIYYFLKYFDISEYSIDCRKTNIEQCHFEQISWI